MIFSGRSNLIIIFILFDLEVEPELISDRSQNHLRLLLSLSLLFRKTIARRSATIKPIVKKYFFFLIIFLIFRLVFISDINFLTVQYVYKDYY